MQIAVATPVAAQLLSAAIEARRAVDVALGRMSTIVPGPTADARLDAGVAELAAAGRSGRAANDGFVVAFGARTSEWPAVTAAYYAGRAVGNEVANFQNMPGLLNAASRLPEPRRTEARAKVGVAFDREAVTFGKLLTTYRDALDAVIALGAPTP